MTADSADGLGFPDPARVSALVVGIEEYPYLEHNAGAVRPAARFAEWLIRKGICAADRITLMTCHGELDEPTQELLDDLSKLDVRQPVGSVTCEAVSQWLDNGDGPKPGDELFVLFWVGHGVASDEGQDVCLLAADATDERPHHLRLRELLTAVTVQANDITRVAFVDACRPYARAETWRRLTTWKWPLGNDLNEPAPRKLSIVYATAPGETTDNAGWVAIGESFADVLVNRLNELPDGSGPQDLFAETGELRRFLRELGGGRQGRPYWIQYGWEHDGENEVITSQPDGGDLTPEEWNRLLDEVEVVDRDLEHRPTWQVLLIAYYHALDDEPGANPSGLTDLGALVRALRMRSRGNWNLPPLVIACDSVANLPEENTWPGLNEWCQRWVAARPGRRELLDIARGWRLHRAPSQSYLSVLVEDFAQEPSPGAAAARGVGRGYEVRGILWAPSGLHPLRVPQRDEDAGADSILKKVGQLLDQASRYTRGVGTEDIVVELVLPRHLLTWRPEYESQPDLKADYPIVIRDLERLRGTGAGQSKQLAMQRWLRIENYEPGRGARRWSTKVKWVDCGKPWPGQGFIQTLTSGKDTFCVGLAPPKARISDEWLIEAVDAGAAIVLLVLQEDYDCVGHPWQRLRWPECAVPEVKRKIQRHIDDRGLLDLPFLLRDIRRELRSRQRAAPRIGVVMEDRARLWPGQLTMESPLARSNGEWDR